MQITIAQIETIISFFGTHHIRDPKVSFSNQDNGDLIGVLQYNDGEQLAQRFTSMIEENECVYDDDLAACKVTNVEYFSCTERLVIEIDIHGEYDLTIEGQRTSVY